MLGGTDAARTNWPLGYILLRSAIVFFLPLQSADIEVALGARHCAPNLSRGLGEGLAAGSMRAWGSMVEWGHWWGRVGIRGWGRG